MRSSVCNKDICRLQHAKRKSRFPPALARRVQSKSRFQCYASLSSLGQQTQSAITRVLDAVKGTNRGVETSTQQKQRILEAVSLLQELGEDQVTTRGPIDATWKLVWTTEKETLFILKNAKFFGTEAGDVFQVIDTENSRLQNVITFKNNASFVVDSSLEAGGDKRLVFKFTAALLNLPSRTFKIPPFGKGWFDTVFLDDEIRVAKDIRGDTLIVQRDGPPRRF